MRLFRRSKKKRPPTTTPRRRVLFVSHEATRTGAPKIILNILKHFAGNCDIQCETILNSGGHLAGEFEKYSTVDCLNVSRENHEELRKQIGKTLAREKKNRPILAICNSMESRFIAKELAALDIPVIMLVHELPSSYSEEDYQGVFETARKVVFPVNAVKEAAHDKTSIPIAKSTVLSQGLLDPTFGSGITRETAYSQIRKELHLPENSFVVLGCGTLDLRKGIDHYTNIARRVIRNNHTLTPVHFVWVGEGPRWTHSTYHYVQLDLEKSPARDYVHFIGERDNVEPYFVGADAFMMSSRVDPFPCVIHEAMAASLPVITFANSGGAAEAIDDGAGFIVPYADYDQAANVIGLLANQPEIASGVREKSKQRVFDRYRFEDYGDKLIDLAESVIRMQIRTPSTIPSTISFPTTSTPAAIPIDHRRAA